MTSTDTDQRMSLTVRLDAFEQRLVCLEQLAHKILDRLEADDQQ